MSGASSRAFQRARAITAARSLGVHGRHPHVDRAHPVERLHVAHARPARSGCGAGRRRWSGPRRRRRRRSRRRCPAPCRGRRWCRPARGRPPPAGARGPLLAVAARGRLVPDGGGTADVRGHGDNLPAWRGFPARAALGCRCPAGAGNMGDVRGAPCAAGRPAARVRRNEEEQVTTISTSVNIGKKPAPVTLSDSADRQGRRVAGRGGGRASWPCASRSSLAVAPATATRCSSTPRSWPTTSCVSSAR